MACSRPQRFAARRRLGGGILGRLRGDVATFYERFDDNASL